MSDDECDWIEQLPQTQKSGKFYRTLREHSVSQEDPIPEWTVVYHVEGDGATHCICTTPIQYQFTIENKHNGKRLTIGSECIKRWGINFVCKQCKSPLGNRTRRLLKKDFLCPECKQEEKRKEALRLAKEEEQKRRLGNYHLFWYGPYYQRKFSEVIRDLPYVELLLNVPKKTKTLEQFEEYVQLYYDILTVKPQTEECLIDAS
jgi:hypothetical protein